LENHKKSLTSSPTGTAEYGEDNAENSANDENDRQADEQGPHPRGIPKSIKGYFGRGPNIFAVLSMGSPLSTYQLT
jgi:hypothetical protein